MSDARANTIDRPDFAALRGIVRTLPRLQWPELHWLQQRIAEVEAPQARREWDARNEATRQQATESAQRDE